MGVSLHIFHDANNWLKANKSCKIIDIKYHEDTDDGYTNLSYVIIYECDENYKPIDCETVANDPNTPAETLAELAKDHAYNVREAVAKNPNTPTETLAELAKDEYNSIREAVAKNPNTPAETLAELAKDEYNSIRETVAKNPNTSQETKKIARRKH